MPETTVERTCPSSPHWLATVLNLATWAWKFFGKPMSPNTARCCIKKCNVKLYHTSRHPYINAIYKLLWALAHLKDTGNVCSGKISPCINLFG